MEGKIPIITDFAITTTLNAIENKTPGVNNLVKKKTTHTKKTTDYDAKLMLS